ncbi:MAG: ORF6N domain-containing protein [Elusimicrobiota bacterium]
MKDLIQYQRIEKMIFIIRGHKVMLDKDLAELYGVPTKRLNEQVRRNAERFPEDFIFQLNRQEKDKVVANCDHLKSLRFSSQLPFAFTEQGVAMLSSVLRSNRAIQVNIQIIRVFVKLKNLISKHKELANRLAQLEKRMDKKDEETQIIFEAIQQLMAEPQKIKKKIGFVK